MSADQSNMLKSSPSINAVADLAGVSIATVSRVLNNSKPVSPKTRERVEAAIDQLQFRANAFGRSLALAQSRVLLVLVPDFANPYFAQIIQGIEYVARQQGYRIMLADENNVSHGKFTPLDAVYDRLADGVISMTHLDERTDMFEEASRLPWVACSEIYPNSKIPHVSIDHRQAAIDAVQHLIHQGHRRIGFITANENYFWSYRRREGYTRALALAGLELERELICVVNGTDISFGGEAANSLLSLARPPTAVFAVSDTLAIGAIKAFHRAGRRVPSDIAVIGFDNIPLSEVFEPSLTTIAQPMRELGAVAAELLLVRLAGGTPTSRILAHTLIIREST